MLNKMPIIDRIMAAFDQEFLLIFFCFMAKINEITPKIIPKNGKIIEKTTLRIPKTTAVIPKLLLSELFFSMHSKSRRVL